MSRDKRYQKLLNSKRWQEVKRIVWQRAQGLCEDCLAEGIYTGSMQGPLDCHHIVPVESACTPQEMKRLCFNPDNIRLLCVPHHIKVHQEMLSHTTEQVQANRQRRQARWREDLISKFTTPKPSDTSDLGESL